MVDPEAEGGPQHNPAPERRQKWVTMMPRPFPTPTFASVLERSHGCTGTNRPGTGRGSNTSVHCFESIGGQMLHPFVSRHHFCGFEPCLSDYQPTTSVGPMNLGQIESNRMSSQRSRKCGTAAVLPKFHILVKILCTVCWPVINRTRDEGPRRGGRRCRLWNGCNIVRR